MADPWHKQKLTIPPGLRAWLSSGYPDVSLDADGLVALADLTTVARRTALTGTSSLLDALVLCPGLHRQQDAPDLKIEYPKCAAMTTGYIFQIDNPATVLYLQNVGETGRLTTLTVTKSIDEDSALTRLLRTFYDCSSTPVAATVAYLAAISLTITVSVLMILMQDWWALAVMGMLAFARLLNTIVVRRRAKPGWKGASEPKAQGDLFVLVSQDRWIRMRGAVNDLKAVTSGQWLRDMTFIESSLVAFATMLVYLDAALAGNAQVEGKVLLLVLMFSSAALLGVVNQRTDCLKMHGWLIKVQARSEIFDRKLDMVNELTKEVGKKDWAVGMNLLVEKKDQ